ncbi:hypothetical protein T12_8259 [Trichinella patagoniensis]|uniref:Uncharacterized protein n=1 Tax=Trichinella patagoniensis TaxID=990121 RepID=A0A0V0ZC86_9BILA|nr:hypothetical protein T12_8259 [Trichinella patagoniensis]
MDFMSNTETARLIFPISMKADASNSKKQSVEEEPCDSEASVPQNFNESYAVFHSLRSQQLKMSTNDKDEKNDQIVLSVNF